MLPKSLLVSKISGIPGIHKIIRIWRVFFPKAAQKIFFTIF